MPYYKELNLLFIHIPKTGGTSLEDYLKKRYTQTVYGFPNPFPDQSQYNLHHLNYQMLYKYKDQLDITFDNIITIVRNPYDRIISDLFYLYLIKKPVTPEEVFTVIKRYIEDKWVIDHHNLPQHTFLMENLKNIKIFKTETLTQELRDYGFTDYQGSHSQNDYSIYLNDDSIKLINEVYRKDFELFDYPMKEVPLLKKTICLNMIVKNESEIIEETLTQLVKSIKFDHYIICDTGSTDATVQIIQMVMEKYNISGKIFFHEWKNFGHNRTLALECAKNVCDYTFIFDADDLIVGNIDLKDLTKDSYMFKFGDAYHSYQRKCLVSSKLSWKFIGILHEYISCETFASEGLIDGNYYIVSGRTSSRNKNPNKYLDDAKLLENGFEESLILKDGLHDRYAYYCANSYKDACKKEEAISWYKKTLTLNGWFEEKYNSCLQLYDLIQDNSRYYYLVESFNINPKRVEGISELIKYYTIKGNYVLAWNYYTLIQDYYEKEYYPSNGDLSSKLFAKVMEYTFYLPYYMIIVCEKNKKMETGVKLFDIIFKRKVNPGQWWIDNLLFNSQFFNVNVSSLIEYITFLDKCTDLLKFFYNVDDNLHNGKSTSILWKKLFEINKKQLIKYEPFNFIKKGNEIILTFTTCKRLDLFEQTINSIINNWKDIHLIDSWFCVDDNSSQEDRNIMKEKYPFIEFYFKDQLEKGHLSSMNIIWEKLEGYTYWVHIEDDFLFYKPFYLKEAIDGFNEINVNQILFNRGYAETIDDISIPCKQVKSYCIHEYLKETNERNCNYWPHFSFRPSIIQVDCILKVGKFKWGGFFEMEYAKRWVAAGYTSGFLNKITNIHIGKLTKESGDNAYSLNGVNQFQTKSFIKVVNLERRTDRKEQMTKILNNIPFEFYKAVDGKELKPTQELYDLFKYNDFENNTGTIGCALSHLRLWKQLLTDNVDYYIIMEDDIILTENFKNKVIIDSTKDLVFYGYSKFKQIEESSSGIHLLDRSNYMGGTFCYSINKVGAQKMIDYINKNGIKHGIDYLLKINKNLELWCCSPCLAFSEYVTIGKQVDSDIQYFKFKLNFSRFCPFVFVQGLDQHNNDLYCKKETNLMEIAEKEPECVAFNTLGFFKNKITKLEKSIYFSQHDGIYIKKDVYFKGLTFKYNKVCFIHSCTISSISKGTLTDNYILTKLLNKVKSLELDYIFVINIGKPVKLNEENKIKIVHFSDDPKLYEIETLNFIHTFSQLYNNIDLLYIHTKGISYNEPHLVKCEEAWVDLMLYFLLLIKSLDSYDTIGCLYKQLPKPHFSGNFWWAKTNYIKTLPKMETEIKTDAEFWLFTNKPNYKSMYNCDINMFETIVQPSDYSKIRIKMLCNWCDSKQLCEEWSNMCDYNFIWKNIEITWEEDVDYYVIINAPRVNDYFIPEKTIIFQMEPWVDDPSKNWGVRTWKQWSEPKDSDFLAVRGRKSNCHNNAFWQLEGKINSLKLDVKYNTLSTIVSKKYYDIGHKLRIKFLHFLESKGDIPLDIYGNDHFKNYKGPLTPYIDKSKGLCTYKYYFMMENCFEPNFITEKIWEPILCETLCFYYGCPNITDYVDSRAFVQLSGDFEQDYLLIKKSIEEDLWSQRIEFIKQMKEKIIHELAFFPVVSKIIHSLKKIK